MLGLSCVLTLGSITSRGTLSHIYGVQGTGGCWYVWFPSGTQPGLLSVSGLAYNSLGGVEADSRSFLLSLLSWCTTRPPPSPPLPKALAGAGGVPPGTLPASTTDCGPAPILPTSYQRTAVWRKG